MLFYGGFYTEHKGTTFVEISGIWKNWRRTGTISMIWLSMPEGSSRHVYFHSLSISSGWKKMLETKSSGLNLESRYKFWGTLVSWACYLYLRQVPSRSVTSCTSPHFFISFLSLLPWKWHSPMKSTNITWIGLHLKLNWTLCEWP